MPQNSTEPAAEDTVLTFDVFEGTGPQPWRWHAQAPNHEIIAHGEGYVTAANAEEGVNTLIGYIVSGRFEVKLPQAP